MRTAAGGISCVLYIAAFAVTLPAASGQGSLPTNGVNGFSLHPPYFNLAEGTKITATATCGEDENGKPIADLYCKLVGGPVSGDPSQTIQGQYCDICSAGDSNRAHPITNAIDGTERWWQSPPLSRSLDYNEVNVTLDLGQLELDLPIGPIMAYISHNLHVLGDNTDKIRKQLQLAFLKIF
ncbi:LAMA5 protein, partial [Polypterus senegalus]